MPQLPADISGRELRTALERAGFIFRRQRGSHVVLRRDDPYAPRVVVPDHQQVRPGTLRHRTLRHILADAGLGVEDLLRLLGRAP